MAYGNTHDHRLHVESKPRLLPDLDAAKPGGDGELRGELSEALRGEIRGPDDEALRGDVMDPG